MNLATPPSTSLLDAPMMIRDLFAYISGKREEFGDFYKLKLGFTTFHLCGHPDAAYHFLVKAVENYEKADDPLLVSTRDFIGRGLPMIEGEEWRRQRKMMQPHFSATAMKKMSDDMFAAVEESLTEWDTFANTGQLVDISELFPKMTMRVITRTLFGAENKYDIEALVEAIQIVITGVLKGVIGKAFPYIPVPGRQNFERALNVIDTTLQQVVDHKRANPSDDLISALIAQTDDENQRMSQKQLRDEVVTLFLAGFETTATALSWSMYFAMRSEYQDLMREEVLDNCGITAPSPPSLKRLTCVQNVFYEALRLNPPSYWQIRNNVSGQTLEYDGYEIPPDATIAISTYLIHRSPDVWDRPNEFDPNRFLPERSRGRHKYAYIPFGVGTHNCIGQGFALMEATYALARLMQKYTFHPTMNFEAKAKASLLMSIDRPILATIKHR